MELVETPYAPPQSERYTLDQTNRSVRPSFYLRRTPGFNNRAAGVILSRQPTSY
jgi:hypothetical protein